MPVSNSSYIKFLRHYSLTIMALIAVFVFTLENVIFHHDLFKALLRSLDDVQYIRTEELVFSVILIGLMFTIDAFRLARRHKRKRNLETEKLSVVRSALASVHDVVNNSLNNFLIVKIEAEKGKPLSAETVTLFGELIVDLASQMRGLNEMDVISKRDLSNGLTVLDPGKE